MRFYKKRLMRKEILSIKINDQLPEAILEVYLWEPSSEMWTGKTRPMVILCPGGAYCYVSDREGDPLAMEFWCSGCHAAILKYFVPALFPTALLQLAVAVTEVRCHAKEWMVDEEKIIVQGCSAGGHLAASLGVFWQEDFLTKYLQTSPAMRKPDGLILNYPVITTGKGVHVESFKNLLGEDYDKLKEKVSLEKQVTEHVPPVFLWTTYADDLVDPVNSLVFVEALMKAGIPTEFHMYVSGVHGLALANKVTEANEGYGVQRECENWMHMARNWIWNLFMQ